MNTGPRRDHLNVQLTIASALVMLTGLVLFTQFHVGGGKHTAAFAGIPRWYWINVHRIAALFFTFFVVHHLAAHWRVVRLLFKRLPRFRGQTLFLTLFLVVALMGLTPWLAFKHGRGGPQGLRHTFIDIHDIAGLFLLAGTVLHLRKRWRLLGHAGHSPSLLHAGAKASYTVQQSSEQQGAVNDG